jgi:hypothetical protein
MMLRAHELFGSVNRSNPQFHANEMKYGLATKTRGAVHVDEKFTYAFVFCNNRQALWRSNHAAGCVTTQLNQAMTKQHRFNDMR